MAALPGPDEMNATLRDSNWNALNRPRASASLHDNKRRLVIRYALTHDHAPDRCMQYLPIHLIDYWGGAMVQAPLAASAGMYPFVTQISINGCIGSISLSESRPKSLATDM